jgi:hypothetical protein
MSCKKGPSLYTFQWLLVSSKTPFIVAINALNKCDSKYSMRSTTKVQVVELWSIKCSRFCARTRKKATTWLQEEEYSEFVMGLHWISLCSKGLCKFKSLQRSQQKGFNMHLTNYGQKKSRNHPLLSANNCLWADSWYLSMSSLSKAIKLCIIVQILNRYYVRCAFLSAPSIVYW